MNYQPNQNGNFYPQQPNPGYPPQSAPQQGAPWQDPSMQQPYMQQPPMQGGMMPQQDFAPMQQTGPMGYMPQQQVPMGYPQQEYPPMQQTGPMGYQPQPEFQPMQQTGGYVPQPAPAPVPYQGAPEEKANPLQTVISYIKDNDLMFLAIAAVVALVYALYVTFSYAWLLKLLPHIIVTWLSLAGNVAVCVLRKKEFGIVAGAGYVVAALLFLNRFYLLIPSVALCAWDFFGKKNA